MTTEPTQPLLSADGLDVSFPTGPPWNRRSATALAGVDLHVHPGERVGVVGESGSGKTTLLRVLLGLQRPDAGRVTYRGRPVTAGTRMPWFRRHVQFVPQDPSSSLNPTMPVLHAVTEPLRCLRIPGDHAARARDVLAAVGLGDEHLHRHPDELSGGQRQRVAIARALAPHPDVLLADEAVSDLDAAVRLSVLRTLVNACHDGGIALVFVSHDLGVIGHACGRVVVLDGGRVVDDGPVTRVFRRPSAPATARLLEAVPPLPPIDEAVAARAVGESA